ncbi:hypothetical protein BUALT_Bualt19G0024000 [Buddleja alternifolia]|uniref:Jacalin-type lectin domain-containing protein n=1 Tax=Buddleja alternifolia TaxID=168488 RepID=A0AAV6W878_9LAMI|nr:hypothetical protein BUALT_Bualt19G0024000 [Buddleja alternifolia]
MGSEKNQKTIAIGPWGGLGADCFDDGTYCGVRKITVNYGSCINLIEIVYEKNCKQVVKSHGRWGGENTNQIELHIPGEFLTGMNGYYSPLNGNAGTGSPIIRSLTFETNQRTFGPFGVKEGTPFSLPMKGGKIVGLIGGSGWYLDAIGAHVKAL